ncbi:hypothetical protein ACU4GD_27490 [Cupriavidus basilensis]
MADHLRKLGMDVKTGVAQDRRGRACSRAASRARVAGAARTLMRQPVKEQVRTCSFAASKAKGQYLRTRTDTPAGTTTHVAILMATAEESWRA